MNAKIASNPAFPVDDSKWQVWLELSRNDAAAADEFYFQEFLASHVAYLQSKTNPAFSTQVLVTLIGFSPMVSAIVAGLLKPSRVVAVGGREASHSVALLGRFLAGGAGGFRAVIEHPNVAAEDHAGVFRVVVRALGESVDAVVDITGGKKIMTAAAAQAAWELDRSACYLEAKTYIPELRRPVPGTEELLFLSRRHSLIQKL